jgi:hypothetical protein
MIDFKECPTDGCNNKIIRRGMCGNHYSRWLVQHSGPVIYPLNLEERFWSKVDKTDGCWVWTASKNCEGYGRFNRFGKKRPNCEGAHRVSYIISSGAEIPDGMLVLHKCDNPPCVNPEHLYLGSNADNARDKKDRGRVKSWIADDNNAKTHCPSGHPYSGDNLYIEPTGGRKCRECNKIRARQWRKNQRT